MILLLGGTGYIGQAFAAELVRRKHPFISLSRRELNYNRFDLLLDYLESKRPEFVINAAGFTGKPNVDACEAAKADALVGNTLLPQTIALACSAAGIPWGHVSSGCIYSGAKIKIENQVITEKDMNKPEMRKLISTAPENISGFTETDTPNFSFRDGPCSFYSGTKALGEETIAGIGQNYIWRLRIPFDEVDSPRNYLSKLQRYAKAYDNVNSISHRADYTSACLDLLERRAPFGIYNVTNPDFITTREVVELMQKILKPNRTFEFWANDEEFYNVAAKTPRSNCVLDVKKLLATGVKIRPVREALEHSLHNWISEII
jgi:dTDP-4-dehydrorhamnose reductase